MNKLTFFARTLCLLACLAALTACGEDGWSFEDWRHRNDDVDSADADVGIEAELERLKKHVAT